MSFRFSQDIHDLYLRSVDKIRHNIRISLLLIILNTNLVHRCVLLIRLPRFKLSMSPTRDHMLACRLLAMTLQGALLYRIQTLRRTVWGGTSRFLSSKWTNTRWLRLNRCNIITMELKASSDHLQTTSLLIPHIPGNQSLDANRMTTQ